MKKPSLKRSLEDGRKLYTENQSLKMQIRELTARIETLKREPEPNLPISRCQCSDSTGWTTIRCCNLCGLMHKSETLDWRTGPLDGK